MSTPAAQQPSPMLFFETVTAYQRSDAIRAAVELELFTAIGEGATTAAEIAARVGAAERGVRILSDFLTTCGFLTKEDGRYGLTHDSAVFLDKRSPAYAGGVIGFLHHPTITGGYRDLAAAVRSGTTQLGADGTMDVEHPVWVAFAHGMAPMMRPAAEAMAEMAALDETREARILDVAAGHGIFGIAFLQRYPNARVVAVDWEQVLEVARENATAMGVADRWEARAGSAFDVDLGEGYDVVLMTNFLHHFDAETNERLLRRVHGALADGGKCITLEFVPNDDRVTPPAQAPFALTMLASTASGDAYTFRELEAMFAAAGFSRSEATVLPPGVHTVVVSQK